MFLGLATGTRGAFIPTEARLYPVSRLPDAAVFLAISPTAPSSEVAALGDAIAAFSSAMHAPMRSCMPGRHSVQVLRSSQSVHSTGHDMQRPSAVEPYCPTGQKGPHRPKVVLDGRKGMLEPATHDVHLSGANGSEQLPQVGSHGRHIGLRGLGDHPSGQGFILPSDVAVSKQYPPSLIAVLELHCKQPLGPGPSQVAQDVSQAAQVREVVKYSPAAHDASHLPLLFSTGLNQVELSLQIKHTDGSALEHTSQS